LSLLGNEKNFSFQVVDRYIIEDGWIKPDPKFKNDRFMYYPLRDYRGYIENRKSSLDPVSMPHIDLSDLDSDDDNAILDFCNKWGLLNFFRPIMKEPGGVYFNIENYPELVAQGIKDRKDFMEKALNFELWESLESFKSWCRIHQGMVKIKKAISPKINHEEIRVLMKDETLSRYLPQDTFQTKEAAEIFADVLSNYLQAKLEKTTRIRIPNFEGDKVHFETQHVSYSLLTSICIILDSSLESVTYYRTCQHKKCGRTFESDREDMKYCCTNHQKLAKAARVYEKVKKERNNNG
jgi:hypothetical protein